VATSTAQQVLDSSIDLDGLSVVTTTMTAAAPRQGMIYNPATLAGTVPVWFHSLNDGRYLALLRERWIDAIVGSVAPQSYTAHTVVTDPSSIIIEPATGHVGPITRLDSALPGAHLLNGAASKWTNFYTVGTADGTPYAQWFRTTANGTWLLGGEELMPKVNGVSFGLGCWIDTKDFLVIAGSDDAGALYLSRKRWGRIGTNRDTNAGYTWEYRAARGWLTDPAGLTPIKDALGNTITTAGPVSSAWHRDRRVLVVVHNASGVRTPVGYVARNIDQIWQVSRFVPPALGDDTGYAGGTLFLQPQLNPNPTQVPDGAYIGFPAVSSSYGSDSGENSLQTGWTMWPVTK
jgi:hypothetical protein